MLSINNLFIKKTLQTKNTQVQVRKHFTDNVHIWICIDNVSKALKCGYLKDVKECDLTWNENVPELFWAEEFMSSVEDCFQRLVRYTQKHEVNCEGDWSNSSLKARRDRSTFTYPSGMSNRNDQQSIISINTKVVMSFTQTHCAVSWTQPKVCLSTSWPKMWGNT